MLLKFQWSFTYVTDYMKYKLHVSNHVNILSCSRVKLGLYFSNESFRDHLKNKCSELYIVDRRRNHVLSRIADFEIISVRKPVFLFYMPQLLDNVSVW